MIDFHVDAASVCWMSIISEWLNQLYFHHSEYLHITFSHRTCSRAKSSQQQHSQSHNNHCKVGKEKIKIHIPRGDKTTHTWVSRGEIFSCLKPVLHLEARPREGVWNTTVVPHPTTSLTPCFDEYTAVHVYIQTLLLLHFYTYTEQKPTPPQGRFFYKPSGRTKDTLTFGWWGGHVHLKQTNSPSSSGVSSVSRRTLGQTQKASLTANHCVSVRVRFLGIWSRPKTAATPKSYAVNDRNRSNGAWTRHVMGIFSQRALPVDLQQTLSGSSRPWTSNSKEKMTKSYLRI